MKKNGKVAIELLVMLVTIVVTSAIIFMLVQADVIKVKPGNADINVLNTEFIPMGREGYLAVSNFKFCEFIDLGYNCIGEEDSFSLGSEVHFIFVVESSTSNGDIKVVENYRIKGPSGELLLDVDEENSFHFEITSSEKKESITFKDFFVVGEELPEGEYTLELLIKNPFLNKKTTLIRKFNLNRAGENFGEDFELIEDEFVEEVDYFEE